MNAITINLNSIMKLSEEKFFQLCCQNPDVKFEWLINPKDRQVKIYR